MSVNISNCVVVVISPENESALFDRLCYMGSSRLAYLVETRDIVKVAAVVYSQLIK